MTLVHQIVELVLAQNNTNALPVIWATKKIILNVSQPALSTSTKIVRDIVIGAMKHADTALVLLNSNVYNVIKEIMSIDMNVILTHALLPLILLFQV